MTYAILRQYRVAREDGFDVDAKARNHRESKGRDELLLLRAQRQSQHA